MDSFITYFITSTPAEDPVSSLPTNEEDGGGGNPAYCVIA